MDPVVPASRDPKRVTQERLMHPGHGELRLWLKGGEPYRLALPNGRRISRHNSRVEFDQLLEGCERT